MWEGLDRGAVGEVGQAGGDEASERGERSKRRRCAEGMQGCLGGCSAGVGGGGTTTPWVGAESGEARMEATNSAGGTRNERVMERVEWGWDRRVVFVWETSGGGELRGKLQRNYRV